MQQFVDAFTDPAALAGHISYVLLILSMLMRTMHWLRIFAVSAGMFSATYYFTLGDFVSMFWESVFTLVNVTQLLILMIENRRGRFSAEEQRFIDDVLKGVERSQVRRLMKIGAWTQVADGRRLTNEKMRPDDLIYVLEGEADVMRMGKKVGRVGSTDFVGEMSYLTGKDATATVVTTTPMRYLAFEQKALKRYLSRNTEIRHAMEASFNRNLVGKLARTSSQLHGPVEAAPIAEIAAVPLQATAAGKGS